MKPEENKITQEELAGMFGSTIPIDVVEMIFDCPDDWTVSRLRSEVRKKSIEYKRTNWQNRLRAAIKDEQDYLTLFVDDD